MKIMLEPGAFAPTRAHPDDAGLDLYAMDFGLVSARSARRFDTGVHVEIPPGYVGMLKSRSGLNQKNRIQSEGVIDAGYTGPIVVMLYNHSDRPYCVERGQKITQLVIVPCDTSEIELVDKLDETERGANGFGSSDRIGPEVSE